MNHTPLLVHIAEAAEMLGVSPLQVQGLIDRGELPFRRISNRTYIPRASILAFAEGEAS